MKKKEPIRAKATSVSARLAPVKDKFLKKCIGSTGLAEWRSHKAKPPSNIAAIANAISTLWAVQPVFPASMIAYPSANRPANKSWNVQLPWVFIPGVVQEIESAYQCDDYHGDIYVENRTPVEMFQKPSSDQRAYAASQ